MRIDNRHISGGILVFIACLIIGLIASITILLAESGYVSYPEWELEQPEPKKKGKKK